MKYPRPDEESRTAIRLLDLVRSRIRRLVLWTDHAQSNNARGAVARILNDAAMAEERFWRAGEAAELSERIDAAAQALAEDLGWQAITGAFALEREDADFLMLLIAIELEPELNRAVAYAQGDALLNVPTPYLSERLCGRVPAPFDTRALTRWRLAAPVDASCGDRLTSPWLVDPAVASAVRSGSWFEPSLADVTTHFTPESCSALPTLHPDALTALHDLTDARESELVGPSGIGRRTLAAQFAAGRGRSLISIDLGALIEQGAAAPDVIVRTLRQAAIVGADVHFVGADATRNSDWDMAKRLGVPFTRSVRHATGDASAIVLKPLPSALRRQLWQALSDAPPPPILASQRLTPAEMAMLAAHPTSTLPLRRRTGHALLSALPTPYDWDDLVLTPAMQAQLRAFESQIRLRWAVYEDWGLSRLTHLGHGISALFGGPSGTGKTMAAQVVARSLGLALLRVDLAGVVNKYVGETEKKLREVFDACEDSNAILFFDEADALFGNRTQVRDANDRFANIEIDYLLQRIERFDGVAILATNRRQDLDSAFVRRLRFVIDFLPPRSSERLKLWQRALLRTAPCGEVIRDEIDWSYLSERLNMTGAEIKNTALNAAFLARADGATIGMTHVLAAAQRELAKQGLHLRVPPQERTDA